MRTTKYLGAIALLTLSSACFPAAEPQFGSVPDEDVLPGLPPEEDIVPPAVTVEPALNQQAARDLVQSCPTTVAGLARDLAGLREGDRFGIGAAEVSGRPDAPYLADGFALDVALAARERPMAVNCIETAVAGGVVGAADSKNLPEMIRHLADVVGDGAWTRSGSAADRGTFVEAVGAICARFEPVAEPSPEQPQAQAAGGTCGSEQGSLPDDLKTALSSIMWAIHDGVAVRLERDEALEARDAAFWRAHGGKGLLASNGNDGFNADFEEDRSYLSQNRGKLYGAAAEIAEAVAGVDWSAFEGRTGVSYDLQTPAGWVRVRGAEADEYAPSTEDTLLLVDLGGDDVHLDEVASNTSGQNAVSIVIDLGGNDTYTYPEGQGANLDAARLPLDQDGSVDVPGLIAGGSASEAGRQGSARNGIAMLFDLGGSSDRYVSLRASQGYAHQGVGVLYDDGGEDSYHAEVASQGAGQFGIGLLVDLGSEDDEHRSSYASQGFGYVDGVGVLYAEGGNDEYECHPDHDGRPAYVAPQMPGVANASMCQGAGLGFRIKDERFSLAGGVGLLIDVAGDDEYEAGVYGQGVGYWQGFGLLADGGGADTYDALYYGQGAAAHFGAGFLLDSGLESDRFQSKLSAETLMMGAAQDFSVGVFVNQGGDEEYELPPVSGGVASCGSVSLFVDNGGMDTYRAASSSALGVANVEACGSNTNFVSSAVFLDVGGEDTFEIRGGEAANDSTWASGEDPTARVFARDVAGGDSGIHALLR